MDQFSEDFIDKDPWRFVANTMAGSGVPILKQNAKQKASRRQNSNIDDGKRYNDCCLFMRMKVFYNSTQRSCCISSSQNRITVVYQLSLSSLLCRLRFFLFFTTFIIIWIQTKVKDKRLFIVCLPLFTGLVLNPCRCIVESRN